ncbi:MAG: ROK family protein [Phycisphaerales bacterium JB063]
MSKSSRYLGIDLGGTNIQAAIYEPDKKGKGEVVVRDSTKTIAIEGSQAVIDRIVKLCDKLIDKAGMKRKDIAGLGIGAPGAIDIDKGVVLRAPNLDWNNFPLAKVLSKEFDFPIVVDNDVNVGAWGEYHAGAGKDFGDQMAIFVGTGIGAGLVLNGKLYHGPRFTAGEIGHTVIEGSGVLGRRSVEDMASRTNMVRRLTALIQSNRPSIVPDLVEGDLTRIRSKILAQAQKEGDELTLEVIADAARYVGMAIASAVTLLSLDCVVVGGGATEALGKPWMKQIEQSFKRHVFPNELQDVPVIAGILDDNAGPIGAALLAQQKIA